MENINNVENIENIENIISDDEIEYEYIYNENTLLKSCSKDNDYNDIIIEKNIQNKKKKNPKEVRQQNIVDKINLFFNINKDNIRKFNPRLPPYKLINK